MKKVSILVTATSAAITMALSFALVACGDDTASTAPDQPIADGESSSSDMDLPESSSSLVPDALSSAVEELSSSIDLLKVDKLLGLTGYIRGGVSPIGMKRKFVTFVEELAQLEEFVYVSGGLRGVSLKISPWF